MYFYIYIYIHRTFFIIVKNRELAEYQLIAELINIFQYIFTMLYHSNKEKLENKPTHLENKSY